MYVCSSSSTLFMLYIYFSVLYFSIDCVIIYLICFFFFFKQKTAYEMRISDWSSDVSSSDLLHNHPTISRQHAFECRHRPMDAAQVSHLSHATKLVGLDIFEGGKDRDHRVVHPNVYGSERDRRRVV